MKKFCGLALSIALLLCSTTTVFAANTYDISESDDGSITVSFYDSGTVMINGDGRIKDFEGTYQIPWDSEEALKATTMSCSGDITHIGDYTFNSLENLEYVDMPDTVNTIGDYAFENCSNLTTLMLSNNLVSIGSSAFQYCYDLQVVKLPDSLKYIGNKAFRNCRELTEIVIPEGVNTIYDYAFEGCTSLQNVYLPKSVQNIGANVFNGIDDTNLLFHVYTNSYAQQFLDDKGFNYELIDGEDNSSKENEWNVSEAGDNSVICTLSEDGTFTVSGNGAMKQYSNSNDRPYKDVLSDVSKVVVKSGVTELSLFSFSDMTNLQSAVFESGITSSNGYMFSGCSNLSSVVLPETIEFIGEGDFDSCSNLKTITLPESVKTIGSSAFSSNGLTSITIPESVTTIQTSAFIFCNDLTDVYMPKNDNITLENSCFSNCPNVVFHVYEGTAAHTWCVENSKNFELVKEGSDNTGDANSSEVPVKLSIQPTQYNVHVAESVMFDVDSESVTNTFSTLVQNLSDVGKIQVSGVKASDDKGDWIRHSIETEDYWRKLPFNTKQYALSFTDKDGTVHDLSATSLTGADITTIEPNSQSELSFDIQMGGQTGDVIDLNPADIVLTIGFVTAA